MGYELVVHYKEEIEKGVYSEEEKVKLIKVGTPTEDTPLVLVAGKVFAQLARRNILVVDIDVYEFTKKKLTYKQTDDGILIKNKKFRFDDEIGPSVTLSTEAAEVENGAEQNNTVNNTNDVASKLLELLSANPAVLANLVGSNGNGNGNSNISNPAVKIPANSLPHEKRTPIRERPIRHEIFDPPPWLLKEAKKRGLKFTAGRQYPILKEKMAENPAAGMIYTTTNDTGERQSLASIHFVPIPVKLEGTFVEGTMDLPTSRNDNLSWSGVIDDNIPSLR